MGAMTMTSFTLKLSFTNEVFADFQGETLPADGTF
jgi:hypothetical protein